MDARKFGPMSKDAPAIGKPCIICEAPFKEGDYTTLASLGPDPDDKEEVRKYLLGKPFDAIAEEIHWICQGELK